MLTVKGSKVKYRIVYNEVIRCLKEGIYQVGDRLPSERMLANQLKVNIATVRRGYRELTLAGIVEKKVGSGAYLRQALDAEAGEKPITFILEYPVWMTVDRFLKQIPEVMKGSGRTFRYCLAGDPDFPEKLKSNILHNMPMVFLCSVAPKYIPVLKQAPHLVICMSAFMENKGLPAVRGEDELGIQMLVDHLYSLGHRRIALLGNNHSTENIQIRAWKKALGRNYDKKLMIVPDKNGASELEEPMDIARQMIAGCWRETGFTALICLNNEQALGAVAGLSEAGIKIPGDVAVTSVGNSRFSRNTVPPLTVYDPDIRGHLLSALELLDYNMAHPAEPQLLRLVRPELIVRSSTAGVKAEVGKKIDITSK